MGAPARRPGARPLRARRGLGAGWLRRHARFMQDEHGSEATGRVGRNRPTERDCLTSSTRYSAFSVQVQSMGVCGCVECAGPGAARGCVVCGCVCSLGVCSVCVQSGQIATTSRGDKRRTVLRPTALYIPSKARLSCLVQALGITSNIHPRPLRDVRPRRGRGIKRGTLHATAEIPVPAFPPSSAVARAPSPERGEGRIN